MGVSVIQMKKVLFVILILSCTQNLFAQKKDTASFSKSAVYAEVLGVAYYYSINYERILVGKKDKLSLRLGLSVIKDVVYVSSFPVMLNYISGDRNNRFEAGGGTLVSVIYSSNPYLEKALAFSLGYRYQRPNGKFLFRAAITPVIYSSNYFYVGAGISFGYVF